MLELSPEYFFFKLPIYLPILITEDNWDEFLELLDLGRGGNDRSIEGYNPFHSIDSTFGGWSNINDTNYFLKQGGNGRIGIKCKRYGDVLDFFIHYNSKKQILLKVGQFPSIADFHLSEIKKYRKVIKADKLKEFSRGIGLAANGVGIGSYVYLRRVFESLIIEAKKQAESAGKIKDDDYQKVRIEERIDLLSNYLPNFLVENKGIYSILSLGIHELNETDCLSHFDVIRLGIEIILDEKLEELEKKEKIDNARMKISNIKGNLKK